MRLRDVAWLAAVACIVALAAVPRHPPEAAPQTRGPLWLYPIEASVIVNGLQPGFQCATIDPTHDLLMVTSCSGQHLSRQLSVPLAMVNEGIRQPIHRSWEQEVPAFITALERALSSTGDKAAAVISIMDFTGPRVSQLSEESRQLGLRLKATPQTVDSFLCAMQQAYPDTVAIRRVQVWQDHAVVLIEHTLSALPYR